MATFKPQLDDNLPLCVPHSLTGFNRRYSGIRDEEKACIFALTGHYYDEDTKSMARAEVSFADQAVREHMKVHQVSDIDSVIGILWDNLPVQDAALFNYHLLNDARYCLTSNLHIPGWPDPSAQGRTNEVVALPRVPKYASVDSPTHSWCLSTRFHTRCSALWEEQPYEYFFQTLERRWGLLTSSQAPYWSRSST
jgi:hypothetical protein